MIIKDSYFAKMKETSEGVFPLILDVSQKMQEIDEELYKSLMFFISKRINRLLLRPFLLRLSYEICGGEIWKQTTTAGAAFELLNISSYQANSSLDHKLGILSEKEKDSQFIASMITRELCKELLKADDFNQDLTNNILKSLSKSNKYIYIAQHFDLNVLNINNLDKYISNEKLYVEDYIKRCYYGTGIFNGECAYVGGLISGAKNKQLDALRNFGENYGIGLQIINDLADFVPLGSNGSISREYQDRFSDLKNGRLTPGLYKIIKTGKKNRNLILNKIINNAIFEEQELNKIAVLLVEEGIVNDIKSLAIKYAKKAEESLSLFPKNEANNLLCLMTTICNENKYLKCFSGITRNSREYSTTGSVI